MSFSAEYDRRPCFFDERDFRFYLETLADASAHYHVLVHAYVLMTNHIHLLATPLVVGGVSKVMQSLGSRYVKFINANSERAGTLWEGRYKACLVARDEHVLAACRYIDLNPVRAGMVGHPAEYRWSSYAALAGTRFDALVTPHAALEQLGEVAWAAYARWCDRGIRDRRARLSTGGDGCANWPSVRKDSRRKSSRRPRARRLRAPSGPRRVSVH